MRKKGFNILLVIIWMIIIFIMSSFNAEDSGRQSGILVNFISNLFNIYNLELLSFFIRKMAHFIEYLILGFLIYNLFDKRQFKDILISIVICFIYAISDEIHQIFVSGRVFQIFDILIDSLGAMMGVFILFIKAKFDKIN